MAEMTLEQQRALAMASARLRLQQQAKPPEPPAERQPDEAELIAGAPGVRFAMGAASPVLGLAQLADEATGGNLGVSSQLRRVDEMKRRGMTPAADLRRLHEGRAIIARLPGYEAQLASIDQQIAEIESSGASADPQDAGADVAGMAGTVMSPVFLKAAKVIKPAASAGARIAQGAGYGAAAGATTPVLEEGDFASRKAIQTTLGTATGAAVPAGVELAKAGGRAVRDTLDLVLPRGAERIATRYQRNLVGDENRNAVAEALRQARELVPGAKPTAGEAVAHLPAGSPVIAQQRVTAAQPGGISAKFGQRALDQRAAIEQAVEARASATDPMRRTALEAANAGGVRSESVIGGIDATLAKPGLRASDVVNRTLDDVKQKIARFTNEQGVIDANDLYTIRKEIGNTIKTHAKDTANWDKKLTAGLERDIQRGIDDAIEAAGGKGWKQYLAEFASRSKGMEEHASRLKAMAKPAQRTNIGGGVNVAEEVRPHIPQMLSRPAMLANAVMRYLGHGVEPQVDQVMARQFLNPQELAKALETAAPAERNAIVEALIRSGAIAGASAGARTQ